MSHLDADDVVVAELDVLVSNQLASLATQLVMLQQPLRPNWRPYNTDRSGITARFKPQARRLEMSLPLDTDGPNYGDCTDENKKIKDLSLRSTTVDDNGTSYAVGVVRENQLLLLPLDYTLQLRPNMGHLNVESAKAKKDGEDSEEEEADEPMTAVEVTVKRRETELQQQRRLNSYSHLQQEEQQEAWVPLSLHAPDSVPADAIWHKLLSEQDTPATAADAGSSAAAAAAGQQQQRQMPPPLSRTQYLRSFVPSCAPAADDALGGAGSMAAAAAAGAGSSTAACNSAALADSASPEVAKAMGPLIEALAAKHPVCSMANVRQWLQQQAVKEPLSRQAAQLSDPLLDALVQATGHVHLIRRMYVAKVGADAKLEPLRKVVVQLMIEKPMLRKADVFAAAKAAGLAITESHYQKVMRELCRNNGNHWTIKTTAEM